MPRYERDMPFTLSTTEKIILAVLLAFIVWGLLGCNRDRIVYLPEPTSGRPDVQYLNRLYDVYNQEYFRNRLSSAVDIDLDESELHYMASTQCKDDGTDCTIHFNLSYTLAPRVAQFTMLHEMCHIKTWKRSMELGEGDHDRLWRGCMLQLDAEGAFREIIIDNFKEEL